MIHWIEGWITVLEDHPNAHIKITTFEQMTTDPVLFFQDIICFYGMNPELFSENDLLDKTKIVHYRKGSPDEWRCVLSQEQQDSLTSMMSDEMFELFNWKR